MRRVRRPLIALIALIVAAAIGYAVKAASSDDHPHRAPSSPAPATSGRALGPLSSWPGLHEYPDPTPGSPGRGARRMITGTGGEYYYTGDHDEHLVEVNIDR